MTRNIKPIYVSILPEMETIINTWGNERLPDNYIFPLINEDIYSDPIRLHKSIKNVTRYINDRMHDIGEKLDIPGVTTHIARHNAKSNQLEINILQQNNLRQVTI